MEKIMEEEKNSFLIILIYVAKIPKSEAVT
jgi:hypothetical protein